MRRITPAWAAHRFGDRYRPAVHDNCPNSSRSDIALPVSCLQDVRMRIAEVVHQF